MHWLRLWRHLVSVIDYLVQFSRSVVSDLLWPHGLQHTRQLAQTHVHRVGDAIQPSHPLSSPSPPTFHLSQHQGLFQWVSSSHQWPGYWGFSFSISLPNEYSGLISFRMNWLDLLAVQGTLKSLLQHHGSKASILLCSVFFIEKKLFGIIWWVLFKVWSWHSSIPSLVFVKNTNYWANPRLDPESWWWAQ